MIEIIVSILAVALLLYILFGGADFGAGIIEIFTGKRGSLVISKSIAPVWEVNHVWLIAIIVILFNAFSKVYSTILLTLHIPVMIAIIGIIFRGVAFTFRYYDTSYRKENKLYTFLFRIFSLITPLFFGITFGAISLGEITLAEDVDFYTKFLKPWANIFSLSVGIFFVFLFAYIASIYLVGETDKYELNISFFKYVKRLFFMLMLAGVAVFIAAELDHVNLFYRVFNSLISIFCGIAATLLFPLIYYLVRKRKILLSRIFTGVQVAMIIAGWFSCQLPVLVRIKDSDSLTIYNTAAPERTIHFLLIALIVVLAIVIPLIIYLLVVFKSKNAKGKY